jgi:hypothetical protein
MEGRNSKSRNLIETSQLNNNENDFIFDPYFIRKSPVLILLGKILYGVLVFILFGFGVYFIYESKQESLFKDLKVFNLKSSEWNKTYNSEFGHWKLQLSNINDKSLILNKEFKKMHDYEDSNNLYYEPLEFTSSNLLSLIQNIPLNKSNHDSSVN